VITPGVAVAVGGVVVVTVGVGCGWTTGWYTADNTGYTEGGGGFVTSWDGFESCTDFG